MNTIFTAIFSLLGAYFFNIVGYAIGMVIATFFSFYFSQRLSKISFLFDFDWKEIVKLIKIGFIMLLAGILINTFMTIDKIMIGKMLGMQQLGLYTIGLMAIQQAGTLPRFFGSVLFPHIQEKYGATKSVLELKNIILRPTYIISRLTPIIIVGLIFVIEPLVYYILPQFKDGLLAMEILLFGYFFMLLSELPSTFVFTINKQAIFVPFYTLAILLNILFNFIFIRFGYKIEGVAMGTSLAYFCFFIIIFTYSVKHLVSWKEIFILYWKTMVIFLYFLLNFLWINKYITSPVSSGHLIISALLKIGCLLLISIPVIIDLEKKEALFSICFSILTKKLRKQVDSTNDLEIL